MFQIDSESYTLLVVFVDNHIRRILKFINTKQTETLNMRALSRRYMVSVRILRTLKHYVERNRSGYVNNEKMSKIDRFEKN